MISFTILTTIRSISVIASITPCLGSQAINDNVRACDLLQRAKDGA